MNAVVFDSARANSSFNYFRDIVLTDLIEKLNKTPSISSLVSRNRNDSLLGSRQRDEVITLYYQQLAEMNFVNIVQKDTLFAAAFLRVAGDSNPLKNCNICSETYDVSKIWTGCTATSRSFYCLPCVKIYLDGEILDSKMTKDGSIHCLCRNCPTRLQRNDLERLSIAETMIERYDRFLLNKVIAEDPTRMWCPRPTCGKIVKLCSPKATRATCESCRLKFCVRCSTSHSQLVSCTTVADLSFMAWKASTDEGCKRCPSCRLYIEKNQGCMHMTCARCHHQFCWICLSNWSGRCTSSKQVCFMYQLLQDRRWGRGLLVRTATKTAALPVGLVVLGVGAGLAAAAGAVVVVGGAAAGIIIVPPLYLYRWWNRRPPRDLSTEIALNKGVRVTCYWPTDLLSYQQAIAEGTLFGMQGRYTSSGIFIAYAALNIGRDNRRHSFLMYFVPSGIPVDQQLLVMPREMLEISFPRMQNDFGYRIHFHRQCDFLPLLITEAIQDNRYSLPRQQLDNSEPIISLAEMMTAL